MNDEELTKELLKRQQEFLEQSKTSYENGDISKEEYEIIVSDPMRFCYYQPYIPLQMSTIFDDDSRIQK